MSKKILCVATYFPPSGGVGSFRVTKFVKFLDSLGWDVSVLTIDEKFYKNLDYRLNSDIDKITHIYRLNFECNNSRRLDKTFLKYAKKNISKIIARENPDYVYLTGGPFNILLLGRYIWNKYKIPYIIDLRDAWKLQEIPTKNWYLKLRWKLSRPRTTLKEKYVFSKAKAICTINDFMCNLYKKEYPKFAHKFHCIPNGFDNDDFKDLKKMSFNKFSIVYAGKFRQSLGFRDPSMIFQVVKKLNINNYKVELLLIGNKEQEIIDICNKMDCSKYCKFLGFKSHEESITYGSNADINLILSTNKPIEQTGKIFDCIKFNKPILVITDVESNLTNICREVGVTSIFKYSEFDKVYNFIKDVYDNNYKLNYKQDSIEKYNRKNLTKELVRILEYENNK